MVVSANSRGNIRDGRSQCVGPMARLQFACNDMGWTWFSPFAFLVPVGHGQHITLHILKLSNEYYSHVIRAGCSRMLWTRASANRKELRGIQNGVDKATTLQLLRSHMKEYDRGILRSILACAIYTQSIRYQNKQADRPVCPFCWSGHEDHLHLFWHCAAWSHIRQHHLEHYQLQQALLLPPVTLRTGIFATTQAQAISVVSNHLSLTQNQPAIPLPAHTCPLAQNIQRMMVDIIKARNDAEPADPPDDFDPTLYARVEPSDVRPHSSLSAAHQVRTANAHSFSCWLSE